MSWHLTKKQRAYKAYLKTAHWKALRESAIERDGGKCRQCGSPEKLQVHHLIYRETFEASVVEDLETRCRKCHRQEHGYGPSDYEIQHRRVRTIMNYLPDAAARVPPYEWRRLRQLAELPCEIEDYARLIFSYYLDLCGRGSEKRKYGERIRYYFQQMAEKLRQETGLP